MTADLTLREHQLVAEAYAAGRSDALTEAAAGMADRWGMHPRYRDDAVQWLRSFAEGKTLAQMRATSTRALVWDEESGGFNVVDQDED